MDFLIWGGAVVTLIGAGLLVYCIVSAIKARKQNDNPEGLADALQRLAALNMGALAISTLGLMMVIIGIVLS